MSSFCNWLIEQFEKYGIENQLTDEKWQKWQAFDQEQSIFERIGDQATDFLKSDYIKYLNKVGQLGGSATNARQNAVNINIGFKSRTGTVLGALSKTRDGIKLEFSSRDTVRSYGVEVEKLIDYLQQAHDEGHPVRIDDWAEIKELNSSTVGIAKQSVSLWVSNLIDEEVMSYTREHFELLQRFGGKLNQRHDNVEQQNAYEVLIEAYKVTEMWAQSIQKTIFPNGYIKIRKSPVNQGNHFANYNWAKIYPEKDSPEKLAITVGISAKHLFLKIDTVNASSELRANYEAIRGNYTYSAIIHILSIEDGLKKNLDELVQWSASYFPTLHEQYNKVAYQLGLVPVREGRQMYSSPIEQLARNQILYGPPGTGKTYHLQKKLAQYTSNAEVLERDVWLKERLEPLNWMQVLTLCLLEFGEKAKVKQLVEHEYFQCKAKLNNRDKNLSNTAWAALQSFTVLNSKTVDYKSHSEPAIFDKTEDAYWFIVEEKLELVEELVYLAKELKLGPQLAAVIKRFSTTTFHQSYGYEEFIEGLKAKTDDEGNIHYSVEPGAFLKLCKRAENDPVHRYAMFIDEINRGNISKIFGELISLIEVDKRSGCKQAMSVKLAYSGEDFSVPANVDIIGTMNTADRSLAMMDTALRRRFDFIEMMPKPELLSGINVKGIDLKQLLEVMNQRIEILYDREHTLGHAFFMPVKALFKKGEEELAFSKLQSVFQNKIIPLLEEYFFEDWDKIRLVLADNQKPESLQFVTETKLEQKALDALFGSKHGLGQFGEVQKQYSLKNKDSEVWNIALAYKGIYAPDEVKNPEPKASLENKISDEAGASQQEPETTGV